MAPTPRKKKARRSMPSLRRGSRDPRQHVHSAGSSPARPLPNSKGNRRGTHGKASGPKKSRTSAFLPSIPENSTGGGFLDLTNSGGSGNIGRCNQRESVARSRAVMEIDGDDDDDDVGAGANNLRNLILFRGRESNNDVALEQALLKSSMVAMLNKNASARTLSFTPDHLLQLIQDLIEHRTELLSLALQADGGCGLLRAPLETALPSNLTKRMKKKSCLSEILVDTFTALEPAIRSKNANIPGPHSCLTKPVNNACSILVRVRNICQHELADEQENKRALRSEPITGEFCEGRRGCFYFTY